MLDIGCGSGAFLREARAHYRCTGIEISAHLATHARALGVDVVVGDFCAHDFDTRGFMNATLFLTHTGEPFTPNRLTQLVRGYVRAANLGKSGSCHLFRHTMATLMLEHGADIRYIQAMLGHAELSTTQIYTQVSIRKFKEIHTATHPGKARTARRSSVVETNVDDSLAGEPTAEDVLTVLAAEALEEPEDEAERP